MTNQNAKNFLFLSTAAVIPAPAFSGVNLVSVPAFAG